MTDSRDAKVVFSMVPGDEFPDGVPMLLFMIPEDAWSYMVDGLGHEFDFTKIGIPMRVLIGRTATHRTGMEAVTQFGKGGPFKDLRDVDVTFDYTKPSRH